MRDPLSSLQANAIFEEPGYHRPTLDPSEITCVSEGKFSGPKGFFHQMPDEMMLDEELFREWLCEDVGIDAEAVDAAFRTVLGE